MKTLVILLMLSALLIAGCTTGLQDSTTSPLPIKPSKPATIQAGPGLWPTGIPAPPSPTIIPALAPAVPTMPSHGAGVVEALPAARPSTSTATTSQVAGWTTYESINNIRDLVFAPDGTLWAATLGGLVHWDLNAQTGARPPYTRYPIQARALALAPDGSLWLALEGRVCHFDGVSCQIYSEADGLMGNEVYTIAVTPDGTVWVGTGQGVSRFDDDSWQSYPSPVATHDLAVTASGEVWAATAGGVGRYLPGEDTWITYTDEHGLPTLNAQVIAAGPSPQGSTGQVRREAGGEVWVYLVWEGVYRFDGAGWQQVEGAGVEIFDIAIGPDGTPWVATAGSRHYSGGNLSYHDGNRWRDVAIDQRVHSFTSIALGPGGIVAASTQSELGLYEEDEWRLLRDGPTSNRVASVAVTLPSQGDTGSAVWFAFGDYSTSTSGLGLSRFDGHEWAYFMDGAEVTALAVGPSLQGGAGRTLWAGVGCSIQRFDGAAWEIVASCEELPSGTVLDIDFSPDGTVWVATGFGLARFDGVSWTIYERLVHALEVAPDGTIWMNGWEGTQNSSYVAHFGGETWTILKSSDSYPGGFSVGAVAADGLLWGTTPEGRLASFDGHSWMDGESWALYDIPGNHSLGNVSLVTVGPEGALWLAVEDTMVRFDRERTSGETWTIYTQDDGLPDSYYQAMAFGPGGEIWFGATRFEPAQTEAGAAKPKAAPRIVETALPIAAAKSPEPPAPYCRPGEAFVELSVPTMEWSVGQILTVTVTLANGDGSSVQLGQIQYSLNVEPDMLVSSDLEPVQHPASLDPGDCDQAHFVLQAIAPGKLVLTASASYEMHALDYSSASWSGCQSPPLEITISSSEPKDCSLANAFPPQESKLVWPTLHQVQPDHPTPGQRVEIRGTGGFLYWNNECGEFRDESARDFQLLFDGEPVDPITCYAHTCLVNLTVPGDASPGSHTISVEGGSSIDIQIDGNAPPPQSSRVQDLELVGYLGSGQARAVAIHGHLAYVGMDIELAVVDVSDPNAPQRMGHLFLPGPVMDIALVKDALQGHTYAYVVVGNGAGLYVVEMADPKQPVVRNVYYSRSYVSEIVVAGTHAYVSGNVLHILDITDPGVPVNVGTHSLTQSASGERVAAVATDGLPGRTYAYMAYDRPRAYGLQVMDVTDPAAPLALGSLTMNGPIYKVAIVDEYAYLLVGPGVGRLVIVDISDPQGPREVKSVLAGSRGSESLTVRSHYLYLAGYDLDLSEPVGSLKVLDVAEPANPVVLGHYAGISPSVLDVWVEGERAYVAAGDGLTVLDVSEPTWPAFIGAYHAHALAGTGRDLAVDGSNVYIVAGESGLQVVDASDPMDPKVVGSHDTSGHAWAIALTQDRPDGRAYAYLADEYNGLRVLDVSNPLAPVEVGAYDLPGQEEFFHGVAVTGDYAYVADGGLIETGLRVFNISEPAHPFESAFLPLTTEGTNTPPSRVWDVSVADSYVYLAAGTAGLRVIDVSDPLVPVEIGTCGISGRADNLTVAGSHVYIVDGDLRVVDVSIPTTPGEVGFYDLPDMALAPHVAVQGDLAYLTGNGLRILDISTPGAIFEVASHPIPQGSVAVASDVVYVLGNGMFVLRAFPMVD